MFIVADLVSLKFLVSLTQTKIHLKKKIFFWTPHILIISQSKTNMQQHSVQLSLFFASGDFCRLLITFANSLYPGQDEQNHLTLR